MPELAATLREYADMIAQTGRARGVRKIRDRAERPAVIGAAWFHFHKFRHQRLLFGRHRASDPQAACVTTSIFAFPSNRSTSA